MGRTTNTPAPFMGLPPRWRVSDLTPSYASPVKVLDAVTVSTTSAAYNPQANSVSLIPSFSNGTTKCDIALLSDDGTGTFSQVAIFTGIDIFKTSTVTVGEWPQGISLGGRNIKVAVSNITGGGSVTVKVLRLN